MVHHQRFLTAKTCVKDEPFHVPQTQKYCAGHLSEWDPKITTFPGLYVLGSAYALLLEALGSICLPEDWQPLVRLHKADAWKHDVPNMPHHIRHTWELFLLGTFKSTSILLQHQCEIVCMLTNILSLEDMIEIVSCQLYSKFCKCAE